MRLSSGPALFNPMLATSTLLCDRKPGAGGQTVCLTEKPPPTIQLTDLGVFRSDLKRQKYADISKNGLQCRLFDLAKILMGQGHADRVLATLAQDRCETFRRKILKFVHITKKRQPPGLRHVDVIRSAPSAPSGLLKGGRDSMQSGCFGEHWRLGAADSSSTLRFLRATISAIVTT